MSEYIAILCPSRGRPRRFMEMVQSALTLAEKPELVRVHLLVDKDDPSLLEYQALGYAPQVRMTIGESRPVPDLLQKAIRDVGAEIILVGADDLVFRSRAWDAEIRKTFGENSDGPFAAGVNDLSGKQKWTHFVINRQWLDAVGHLTPAFEHFCVDEYVERIAKAAGRWAYLTQVEVQHVHKKYNRSLNDETYAAKRVRSEDGSRPSDRDEAMLKSLLPEIEKIAERVKAQVGAYRRKWRGGTFTTAQLRARFDELMPELVLRAHADRAAGRFPAADKMEELEEVARELVRLYDNGLNALMRPKC